MDEANAPPPTPESKAHAISTLKEQSLSDNTMPAISIGAHSKRDVEKTTFLPPETWVRNELGIRSVPPESPATPGRRKSAAL